MIKSEYEAIYQRLLGERMDLEKQRAAIEASLADLTKEIESLNQTMGNLAPLAGYDFDDQSIANLGITEATRKVLALDRDAWMSVNEIKTKMSELDYDFSKYSAPDASLHTTLKRLVDAGRAEFKKEEWKIFYKFKQTDDDIPF
jgi:hypothetical protein